MPEDTYHIVYTIGYADLLTDAEGEVLSFAEEVEAVEAAKGFAAQLNTTVAIDRVENLGAAPEDYTLVRVITRTGDTYTVTKD